MTIIEGSKMMREGCSIARPIMGKNYIYADNDGLYIRHHYGGGHEEHQFDCDELEAKDWTVIQPGAPPW